jgi:hypothetical protein
VRSISVILVIAGCGFSGSSSGNGDKPDAHSTTSDGAPPTDAATGDGPPGCTPGYVDVCGQPDPDSGLDISDAQTLNTDSDPRCTTVMQGSRPVCLVYRTEVTISSSGSLTATGSRPLAIVAKTTMMIDGAIDVGSHGAQLGPSIDDGSCAFAKLPEDDLGGGGGGAGATYTLDGGNGGVGDTDNSQGNDGTGVGGMHGTAVALGNLRGGCRGQKGGNESAAGLQGGAGGHSGGALYLGAKGMLSIGGAIRATGAGGAGGQAQAGGGGGGTGGLVVIEAPAIHIGGQLSANGGGGGQGGGRVGTPGNFTDYTGIAGGDGAMGTTVAAGGFGANSNDTRFSTGGTGGAGSTAATIGGGSAVGGGGGGGAAGAIHLIGSTQLGGSTISPPPS